MTGICLHSFIQSGVVCVRDYLKLKAREHMDLLRKYEDWQVKKKRIRTQRQDHVINTCLLQGTNRRMDE
nr:MAG: hypothetical protein CM15mV30_0960 [uncultured marine virus]